MSLLWKTKACDLGVEKISIPEIQAEKNHQLLTNEFDYKYF